MPVSKVSCYIIAYNEANKIRPAIESVVEWADEVILCDSHSTDDTAKIARELGVRVVQIDFSGFGALRNERLPTADMSGSFRLTPTSAARPRHATRFSRSSDKITKVDQWRISCHVTIISSAAGSNIRAGIQTIDSHNCFGGES